MSRTRPVALCALLACCAISAATASVRDTTETQQQHQQQQPGGALLNSAPGQLALQLTGMSPLAQSMKFLMPNAYQGATQDLTNGYYMVSDGAAKGYGGLTSQFSSLGDNLVSRYHSMQASLVESLQQQVARQDALLKQMYEMVQNPEQMCRDLAKQTKDSAAQASQMAAQAQQQSGSFMNKWMGK